MRNMDSYALIMVMVHDKKPFSIVFVHRLAQLRLHDTRYVGQREELGRDFEDDRSKNNSEKFMIEVLV